MKRVAFICRGSTNVGLGHLMRCRTIAREAAVAAEVRIVALGDPAICSTLLGSELPVICAVNDDQAAEQVQAWKADVVCFDLLSFDPEAFASLNAGTMTVCLSPICNLLGKTDLAFARAASPIHLALAAAGHGGIYTGCRYATISSHCRQVDLDGFRRGLALDPLAVAISMGGSDAANHTLQILEAIRDLPAGMLFWIMLGEGYTHSYEQLIDSLRADGRHEIILAKTNQSMWRILGGCSVAVVAGGITSFEAAYVGIPAINVLRTDEDRFLIDELVSAGAALYAGAPITAALPRVVDMLAELHTDRKRLVDMHRHGRQMLDNKGPQRIVNEIHRAKRLFNHSRGAVQCA